MKTLTRILSGAALCALGTGAAWAEINATATTDLNIRSGPGPTHEIVGVIEGGKLAVVDGCLEDADWCKVSHDGVTGWSYADYLSVDEDGSMVSIATQPSAYEIVTLEEDTTARTATAGAAIGATVGALSGGPIGAVIGGAVAGGAAGALLDDSEDVIAFVRQNPVETVYLDGETVAGAVVPETVETYDIPSTEYVYAYVNGQPIVIEPAERKIVRVIR